MEEISIVMIKQIGTLVYKKLLDTLFRSNCRGTEVDNSIKNGGINCTNTNIYIKNINYTSSDLPPPPD